MIRREWYEQLSVQIFANYFLLFFFSTIYVFYNVKVWYIRLLILILKISWMCLFSITLQESLPHNYIPKTFSHWYYWKRFYFTWFLYFSLNMLYFFVFV